jgi:hypothetical protein
MGLIDWLARKVASRLPPAAAPPPALKISLEAAIETLLVKAVEANGKALESRSISDVEFLKAMADLKAKTAGQLLGSRGGTERVRRMRERQAKVDPTWCPVCRKDNARSTRAIIVWHMRGHNGARPPMGVLTYEQSRPAPSDTRKQPDSELQPAKSDSESNSA